jgi:hypothetical protein
LPGQASVTALSSVKRPPWKIGGDTPKATSRIRLGQMCKVSESTKATTKSVLAYIEEAGERLVSGASVLACLCYA